MKLSELPVGKKGVVLSINGHGELRYRLLEMGIVPGVKLLVERVAPFGDPIVVLIQRSLLGIRKNDAEYIEMKMLEDKK